MNCTSFSKQNFIPQRTHQCEYDFCQTVSVRHDIQSKSFVRNSKQYKCLHNYTSVWALGASDAQYPFILPILLPPTPPISLCRTFHFFIFGTCAFSEIVLNFLIYLDLNQSGDRHWFRGKKWPIKNEVRCKKSLLGLLGKSHIHILSL